LSQTLSIKKVSTLVFKKIFKEYVLKLLEKIQRACIMIYLFVYKMKLAKLSKDVDNRLWKLLEEIIGGSLYKV
jgi:hypothetical protein